MNTDIDISSSKSYATEANLDKAIAAKGFDDMGIRYIKCRNKEGRWTCIVLAGEYLRKHGGYAGIGAPFLGV